MLLRAGILQEIHNPDHTWLHGGCSPFQPTLVSHLHPNPLPQTRNSITCVVARNLLHLPRKSSSRHSGDSGKLSAVDKAGVHGGEEQGRISGRNGLLKNNNPVPRLFSTFPTQTTKKKIIKLMEFMLWQISKANCDQDCLQRCLLCRAGITSFPQLTHARQNLRIWDEHSAVPAANKEERDHEHHLAKGETRGIRAEEHSKGVEQPAHFYWEGSWLGMIAFPLEKKQPQR